MSVYRDLQSYMTGHSVPDLHGKYVFHVFHMSSEGCVFVFHLKPPGDGIHAEYPRMS